MDGADLALGDEPGQARLVLRVVHAQIELNQMVLIPGVGCGQLDGPMAMSELHPDVWWGLLIAVIGLIYTVKYWPWKKSRPE